MRALVREHNIYRWAGNLITELARLRPAEISNGKINKALYPRYFFGEINNSLLNKINRYHKIALFLDYDGTLVPIQKILVVRLVK